MPGWRHCVAAHMRRASLPDTLPRWPCSPCCPCLTRCPTGAVHWPSFPAVPACPALPLALSPGWQGEELSHLVVGAGVVLLQREVPEHVNMAVAAAAAAASVPVIQVGHHTPAAMGDCVQPHSSTAAHAASQTRTRACCSTSGCCCASLARWQLSAWSPERSWCITHHSGKLSPLCHIRGTCKTRLSHNCKPACTDYFSVFC
jgi:hypothetical protein